MHVFQLVARLPTKVEGRGTAGLEIGLSFYTHYEMKYRWLLYLEDGSYTKVEILLCCFLYFLFNYLTLNVCFCENDCNLSSVLMLR